MMEVYMVLKSNDLTFDGVGMTVGYADRTQFAEAPRSYYLITTQNSFEWALNSFALIGDISTIEIYRHLDDVLI